MRTDAMTIQLLATTDAATDALPQHALGARAGRFLAIAATVLATTLAVLLASGLAVVVNLSWIHLRRAGLGAALVLRPATMTKTLDAGGAILDRSRGKPRQGSRWRSYS
jgi:hypothetical protein